MLRGKKIILAVSGGIAAYKIPLLLRLLVKEDASVRIVMTADAGQFVTPQTLSVLSHNPVWSHFFSEGHSWNNHVELAEWGDLMVIAPLTANTLAKMVTGSCDNVLLATYLSARCPVMVAPAMDLEMYRHVTVKNNLGILTERGHMVIPAETGELASGLHGEGRMAEPHTIFEAIKTRLAGKKPLTGKKALVNAGPTVEPIDPVRFISNRSTGKMGIEVAEALADAGAEVTLVLGPTPLEVRHHLVSTVRVETSSQMHRQTMAGAQGADIIVCAAAVADYTPAKPKDQKLKKKDQELSLELIKTPDILAELGSSKDGALLVGFALETDKLLEYAREKLAKKNLDMIVANGVSAQTGFGTDTNQITIIDRHNKTLKFQLKSKHEAARDIVNHIISLLNKK